MFKQIMVLDTYRLPSGMFVVPHRNIMRGEAKEQYEQSLIDNCLIKENDKQQTDLLK